MSVEAQLLQSPDYRWMENGQSVYSGAIWRLYQRIDQLFLRWAAEFQAREYNFPTFLPVQELSKLDYFSHFPHLATFPVVLDLAEDNLKEFAAAHQGCTDIHLSRIEPVQNILTPAACYHFYVNFQGEELTAPRYVTTRATCYRHETEYHPLRRQWSFSMREIVCIGTNEEVRHFLNACQEKLTQFFRQIDLPIGWQVATDPFFNPSQNPKFLMQKLAPVKHEMIFGDELAIGSINFHRNYFGEAFNIRRAGEEAFSGCVAFGVDRWIYAFLQQYGFEESAWPELESAG